MAGHPETNLRTTVSLQKLAIPLLLFVAVGAGIAFYLNQPGEPPPAPPGPQRPAATVTPEPKPQDPPPAAVTTVDNTVRTNVPQYGDSHADAPQGLTGHVVLPDGRPGVGIPVLLVESAANDPLKILLANSKGKVPPPLASTRTDQDGSFRLGILTPSKAVDLRVLSDENPEVNRQQIKVHDGDWLDLGSILLDQGLVVQGRVVDEATQAGLANATVYLQASNMSHAVIATPGRERGVAAITDNTGFFRFGNAPRMGLVNLFAEAPGYASAQVTNSQLKADGVNEFTLKVERGEPIAGVIIDQRGKPIAGARVDVIGLSVKTPANATTISEPDGSFFFPNLRAGPYQLAAVASQFADARIPLVLTGEQETKVVMSQRASVKLKVLAANRQPVKVFAVGLKSYHEGTAINIGNVPDFPERRVTPGDYPAEYNGEWALIRGVPGGKFCFQITDRDHAKTLSPAFTVVDGGPEVEVVCELTLGASITGTVIDDRGSPVANATVNTDLNGGLAAETQLFDWFRQMMPEKHTKATVRTDAQGRFRINKLAFADYMLRVSHADYCEGTAIDIKLEREGQVVDAGVIQLNRGAIVEGVTSVAGAPMGQIKVVLSVPLTNDVLPGGAGKRDGAPLTPPTTSRALFSANVLSENNGQFALRKRVPPGEYKVTASRQDPGNPFLALMDMKETEQKLVILPGQDRVQLSFNLSKR